TARPAPPAQCSAQRPPSRQTRRTCSKHMIHTERGAALFRADAGAMKWARHD
ncbi:hypothetical protein HYPSUDRAFT_42906, partial [Hypholoma sublateritium FD-334 SS-4]